ncbi:TlyA family RNA methyltransferase [Aquisalinus flavus]|uniref:TlyA family rRNA (Cytidine-2'-O)-methyltransferase n=1 Tax=Aquisalinus flavus TaxID=1526572 RepID=A0A8J2Y359_9PROT|nr:TlyA family RNA methyltransferase [Aquisalinus flavus]MBD0427237.1 TlyA family RNA methyltransferase [Aquisalinus flavus]UNE47051.1 TlyA family RNA methyltransferase [Aquisalinus flavus]GGC99404.1 TlyA family rRNA (cytidine-2'-O)-methyltransferase [Aquisalinus flavus]
MRLDLHLVESGLCESRARAQSAIAAGLVRVNGTVADKPSRKIGAGDEVTLSGEVLRWVSRGGLKLEKALEYFGVDPAGMICLDLGASTGGFCDVLLAGGAAKIHAVDVGHGQLHDRIAGDSRVVNLEKTHAKDLSPALVAEPLDLVVTDVSFISLKKALPPALDLIRPGGHCLALVKPQFEVGRGEIGKGGLVRPGRENAEGVAEAMLDWIAGEGFEPLGWCESPIAGGDGNREFLIGARKKT